MCKLRQHIFSRHSPSNMVARYMSNRKTVNWSKPQGFPYQSHTSPPSKRFPTERVLYTTSLKHLAGSLSNYIREPIRAADHEAMPSIAFLNHVKCTGFQLLGSINYHLNHLRRKGCLILLPNDVGRGDMAPGSVRLYTRVDSKTLVHELGSPLIALGRGEIVVEYLLCILWLDAYDPFLDY